MPKSTRFDNFASLTLACDNGYNSSGYYLIFRAYTTLSIEGISYLIGHVQIYHNEKSLDHLLHFAAPWDRPLNENQNNLSYYLTLYAYIQYRA